MKILSTIGLISGVITARPSRYSYLWKGILPKKLVKRRKRHSQRNSINVLCSWGQCDFSNYSLKSVATPWKSVGWETESQTRSKPKLKKWRTSKNSWRHSSRSSNRNTKLKCERRLFWRISAIKPTFEVSLPFQMSAWRCHTPRLTTSTRACVSRDMTAQTCLNNSRVCKRALSCFNKLCMRSQSSLLREEWRRVGRNEVNYNYKTDHKSKNLNFIFNQ